MAFRLIRAKSENCKMWNYISKSDQFYYAQPSSFQILPLQSFGISWVYIVVHEGLSMNGHAMLWFTTTVQGDHSIADEIAYLDDSRMSGHNECNLCDTSDVECQTMIDTKPFVWSSQFGVRLQAQTVMVAQTVNVSRSLTLNKTKIPLSL